MVMVMVMVAILVVVAVVSVCASSRTSPWPFDRRWYMSGLETRRTATGCTYQDAYLKRGTLQQMPTCQGEIAYHAYQGRTLKPANHLPWNMHLALGKERLYPAARGHAY